MKKLFVIFLLILSGCAITQEVPKCELMLRGEECLSDHRCCNPPQAYHQPYSHWSWWYWNKPVVNKTIIINKPNKPKPNRPRPNRFKKNKRK